MIMIAIGIFVTYFFGYKKATKENGKPLIMATENLVSM